ncbi:MAG: hypothetical protein DME87_10765 [Verrucomicrobia bacterium]|nr:MAG: hypothetical protein DME87_10765 [Verrucomicrobiota bacterium]
MEPDIMLERSRAPGFQFNPAQHVPRERTGTAFPENSGDPGQQEVDSIDTPPIYQQSVEHPQSAVRF